MTSARIAIVIGTRPEAIKLAPIVRILQRHSSLQPFVVSTGQHREMLQQALTTCGIAPDVSLDVMAADQALAPLASSLITKLDSVWRRVAPDWVVVQGDTTSTFGGALSSFYAGIPVAHVEAGLRTGDRKAPFPEEGNRRMTDAIADLCFAPTEESRRNLLREGIDDRIIHVTGNTGIDAVRWMRTKVLEDRAVDGLPPALERAEQVVLVTAHRRESFGAGLQRICDAMIRIAERRPRAHLLYPVHLNPQVGSVVRARLAGIANVSLTAPLEYRAFVSAMLRADVIVTDSGGVQEEAAALGKPVVVMRDVTDRPEAIAAGVVDVAGTEVSAIVDRVLARLDSPGAVTATDSYGDGRAAERIVAILAKAVPGR